jgi:hypothetical protein
MKNNDQLLVGYSYTVSLFGFGGANVSVHRQIEMSSSEIIFCENVGDKIITVTRGGVIQEWGVMLADEYRHFHSRVDIVSVCISGGEDLIAVAAYGGPVMVVELAIFTPATTIATDRSLLSLQFSSAETRLLGWARGLHVFDIVNGSQLFTIPLCGGVCFNLDGTCVYGYTSGDDGLFCRDVETGSSIDCSFRSFGVSYQGLSVWPPIKVILL